MSDETWPPIHRISQKERDFHYQVGVSITKWAQIDERLFEICAALLGSDKHLVAIIYYRTNTLGGRLTLIDELVKTVLPPKDRPDGGKDHPTTVEWKKIRSGITDLLKVRNQLAHSGVVATIQLGPQSDGKFGFIDEWWASSKTEAERLRGREDDKKELMIGDVKTHAQLVSRLREELTSFEGKLPDLLSARVPPKSPPP